MMQHITLWRMMGCETSENAKGSPGNKFRLRNFILTQC